MPEKRKPKVDDYHEQREADIRKIAAGLSRLADECREAGDERRATQLIDAAILLVGSEYA